MAATKQEVEDLISMLPKDVVLPTGTLRRHFDVHEVQTEDGEPGYAIVQRIEWVPNAEPVQP